MRKVILFLTVIFLFITQISAFCNSGQIDINTASAEELDKIVLIGPARAQEMIKLRPFSSVEDMIRIDGIGPNNINNITSQGLACVEEEKSYEETVDTGTNVSVDVNNTNLTNLEENSLNNKNIQLETINLDTKAIKTSSDSKVSDNKNLAIYGLFIFAVLLGMLFLIKSLIKKRKQKNELA